MSRDEACEDLYTAIFTLAEGLTGGFQHAGLEKCVWIARHETHCYHLSCCVFTPVGGMNSSAGMNGAELSSEGRVLWSDDDQIAAMVH